MGLWSPGEAEIIGSVCARGARGVVRRVLEHVGDPASRRGRSGPAERPRSWVSKGSVITACEPVRGAPSRPGSRRWSGKLATRAERAHRQYSPTETEARYHAQTAGQAMAA